MAGGCGVGAFCSFCGKCGRKFGNVFSADDVPDVPPPGVSDAKAKEPGEMLKSEHEEMNECESKTLQPFDSED